MDELKHMDKLKYKILKSGSSGNCVIIEDMIFDIGIAYKDLKKYLYKTKYIFITHRHTDHINTKTLDKIRNDFPRIKIIGNFDLHQRFFMNEIVGDDTTLTFKDRTIRSFACLHDVPCHGFTVTFKDGRSLIYATDTSNLDHAPSGKYDYLFIESNHCENKIAAIQNNARQKYGYDAWEGAIRHLSTQKSKAFYYLNRRDAESEWIELHKSKRFY